MSIRPRNDRALCHRAWISMGYPSRGVHAGKFVSIQVKCAGLKIRPDSGSIFIPLGVPAIMERPMLIRISRRDRPAQSISSTDRFTSRSVISEQAAKNQSGASDVSLLPALSPRIILGMVPLSSNWPNCLRIALASSVLPAAIRPLTKIRVSRPQSRNQGYPAMTVFDLSRLTT